MAELLKDMFGHEMVHGVAAALAAAHGDFDVAGFTSQALDGYDDLELTPRCKQIAAAMADYLPADRAKAIDIIIASLGPELENCDPADAAPIGDAAIDDNPMSGFFYMAHGYFLADHGGDHFDRVMAANYEITKRATSEFSIRTPLRDDTERTLDRLAAWVHDPNVHVRRCVSEGTRSRLPWSFRLKAFQEDPRPVIALLEELKDDPVEYVRRSVANNLNDIAKDHPDLVIEVARRWWNDGDRNRRRLVRHGLRTLIKAANPEALDVLGYGPSPPAIVAATSIEPSTASIGDKIKVEVEVNNPGVDAAGALVDLRVHFVKANGTTSPKVFKGAELSIEPGGTGVVRKSISVAQHSTRTHYPGEHQVEIVLNGVSTAAGSFTLTT